MNVRQVKRKCYVRGCKNTVSYSVSKTREMGNSIIVCRECAEEIAEAIIATEKAALAEYLAIAEAESSEAVEEDVSEFDTNTKEITKTEETKSVEPKQEQTYKTSTKKTKK